MRNFSKNNIAPNVVFRGEGAWVEGRKIIPDLCRRPLFIGRSQDTFDLRNNLFEDLRGMCLEPFFAELENDCCEEDLSLLENIMKDHSSDGIVAAGGGKVLDSGKLLANRLDIPCITVPLSASTCAGWTALSNIYSAKGAFIKDVVLNTCPQLLIFDHSLVRTAPTKTLASGIADAIAKWYEASVSSGSSDDGLVQQAVQMARVLRDQLLLDGTRALQDIHSKEWIRVAEACSITAGLIGGIGGAKCRTVGAHAVHNALTQLDSPCKSLHGEKVGFGVLVQLRLEELLGGNHLAGQARKQLIQLFKQLNLPTSLESLGYENLDKITLKEVCNFACRPGSEIHYLPFEVNQDALLIALLEAGEKDVPKLPLKV
ncbi:iron-containing alcohol dehydrogenase [Prochlorococcus sp. MIT 1341]|uniref:iron-containing alcohol dehydrogenase n=1 Tax=Prochlorococcus sp. MIT 1341 TaxID=3096221 RepID=UPI002A74E000|nr:iron-containing alcohol dehydrogenase [Prochlorococcus sp. MIT 1341]